MWCLYSDFLQENRELQEQSQEMQRPSSPEPGHSTEVSVIFLPPLRFGLRRQVLTESMRSAKQACLRLIHIILAYMQGSRSIEEGLQRDAE